MAPQFLAELTFAVPGTLPTQPNGPFPKTLPNAFPAPSKMYTLSARSMKHNHGTCTMRSTVGF